MQNKNFLISLVEGKSVLFIATRDLQYLRCNQELSLIEQYARETNIIGSSETNYIKRSLIVYLRLLSLIFKRKPEVILVSFAAQIIFPFYIFHFFSPRAIVITDFFISSYDTFVSDRMKVKERSLIAKLLHLVDTLILSKSNWVICDTKTHGAYFSEEFHQDESKFIVLYIEPNHAIYFPRNVSKDHSVDGKFVVLYFGSILPLQGIEVILQAAENLSTVSNIAFIIIGPVTQKLKAAFPHARIEYYPWLAETELADQIAVADLCLAGHFNAAIPKSSRTIAGKTYIYRAMNKCVILGDNTANRELFDEEESKGVYYVEMGNPTKLSEKIFYIYNQGKQN